MCAQSSAELSPIRVDGASVGKIWGGTHMGEPIDGLPVGERWVLSTRPEGESYVATGSYAGKTLLTYLRETGAAGIEVQDFEDFPVLVKQLETGMENGPSVQVHPDDAYAQAHGMPFGKAEMWVIESCEPGAFIYHGVSRSLTPDEFAAAIQDDTICDLLNKVEIAPGDVYLNPAGCIHAAGPGMLFWEVQQNSDTTYRIYDYGQVDASGKPRELHIEAAKETSILNPEPEGDDVLGPVVALEGGTRQELDHTTSYVCERYVCNTSVQVPVTAASFVSLTFIAGDATLTLGDFSAEVHAGETWFVPAQDARVEVEGAATFLAVRLP